MERGDRPEDKANDAGARGARGADGDFPAKEGAEGDAHGRGDGDFPATMEGEGAAGGGPRDTGDFPAKDGEIGPGAGAGGDAPDRRASGDIGDGEGARDARDAREGPDEQEARVVDAFKGNEAFQPREWERLDRDERLSALQGAEDEIAGIQGRDPLPVRVQEGAGEGDYGGYNGHEILIGEHSIENDPVNEVVNTLAHGAGRG